VSALDRDTDGDVVTMKIGSVPPSLEKYFGVLCEEFMASEQETLFAVFRDHTSIVNSLWGIFQTVSLGLLGYVYTQQSVRENPSILFGLCLLFFVFGIGNRAAIARSQAVLRAVHDQFHDPSFLEPVSSGLRFVMAAHSAHTVQQMRGGHWVTVGLVLVGAWVPFLARLCGIDW